MSTASPLRRTFARRLARSRSPTLSASARAILDRISKRQSGKLAAANTANRKRAVLNNIM
jgi:hypothetical protein